MNPAPLSIIIVNWNSGALLTQCLRSVAQHHESQVQRVIVVDNASSDGSLDIPELPGLPFLEVVRNSENVGFGRACNTGAARCDSEFLLFLNPDAELRPGVLRGLLAFLVDPQAQTVGIVGPLLRDTRGQVARCCARFPQPWHYLVRAIGLESIVPAAAKHLSDFDHLTTREVDHVMGCFLLMRSTAFRSISGFDQRFFVYLEDLDLSLRAKRAGWSSWYVGSAEAYHLGGGTTRSILDRRLFYSLRSRLQYSHKHFGILGRSVVIIATLGIEPFSRCAQAIVRGSWRDLKGVIGGVTLLYGWCAKRLLSTSAAFDNS